MYKFNEADHVHLWNDMPLVGTTTLIGEMMPPPLAWWASGKALEKLGWLNVKYSTVDERYQAAGEGAHKVSNMTQTEYADFLQECYKNHDSFKKEAGVHGTNKHDLIEQAVKDAIQHNGGFLRAEPYEDEAVERYASWGRGKRFIHSEVHVYSEFLWLGGIVDLIYEEEGTIYSADIKTSKSMYPSAFMQMGLYDLQQQENGFVDKDGNLAGESQKIEGYTVVNIPKDGGMNVKTYRNTEGLRNLGLMLVEGYKLKKELEKITN